MSKPEECSNGCPENQVCDYCQYDLRIEQLKQQLSAALAACKLKHSALKTLWIGTNREEWDGGAIKSFEDALAIQPDDAALMAWLGEPVAKKIKYGALQFLAGYSELPPNTELYSPKGEV